MSQTKPLQAGLRAGLQAITNTLEILSSIIIAIMMVLTFVDVIGRYLFASPIFGANEMISALLALAIFAGLGITNARDDHIVVELLDQRIRRISPRAYDVIIQLFSIIAMTLVAYVLLDMAIETLHQKARTFVLENPLFAVAGSVSALAALSVISQVIGDYLRLTGDQAATPSGGAQ